MGNRHAKKLTGAEIEVLISHCNFSTDRIIQMHREFVREFPTGHIDHNSFLRSYKRRFPDADDEFCERLFHAHDTNGDGDVSFAEFLVSLNVAFHGTPSDKLRWAFRMFDVDGNGMITRSEIVEVLKATYSLGSVPDADEKANSSAEMIMNTLDCDRNGELSLEEFIAAASQDPTIVDLIKAARV